ncbi:MAG: hypothetical protein WC505_07655 [Patescibacteria group bacterium]
MPKFHYLNGCDTPGFEYAKFAITCIDHSGRPIGRVQEFDTDTGLAIVKVADYGFFYTGEQQRERLLKSLPAQYHDKMRETVQSPNVNLPDGSVRLPDGKVGMEITVVAVQDETGCTLHDADTGALLGHCVDLDLTATLNDTATYWRTKIIKEGNVPA